MLGVSIIEIEDHNANVNFAWSTRAYSQQQDFTQAGVSLKVKRIIKAIFNDAQDWVT